MEKLITTPLRETALPLPLRTRISKKRVFSGQEKAMAVSLTNTCEHEKRQTFFEKKPEKLAILLLFKALCSLGQKNRDHLGEHNGLAKKA
ncbi:MAG: hypothetical protein H9993_07170 [Candidatus Desulfovibrio faecigallinarum]|nr:hypothetical protein [Candidatus Desulfovibrio faecigallinarum]